ncbi:MAG: hypothetical protein AB1806_17840 [Acidobacteriota bacterium]
MTVLIAPYGVRALGSSRRAIVAAADQAVVYAFALAVVRYLTRNVDRHARHVG